MDFLSGRFRDPGATQYDFLASIMVRCPGCEEVARVLRAPDAPGEGGILFGPLRLVCRGCGMSRVRECRSLGLSFDTARPATDPYFGLPLWLQTETRHGWLWAYDLEHLDLIRRFVEASLRERSYGGGMTLVARLPVWIKQTKNRDEVLRAVGRIQASLVAARTR
ncbi:hypothetical protein ACFTWD_30815 [Streptomyces sp. NPDC056943]|uniref:hypothetical protein n=1 Tax=Streptomyces sp. NPDC056943 TaxID=3345971 RepID=UPI003642855F